MNYLTKYYKNLSEQLQERLSILEAQLNEVKITKFVGDKAVKFDPTPTYTDEEETQAEVDAGAYPGNLDPKSQSRWVLSDEGKIQHNQEKEAEAKKLRDMKRKSVETSSTSSEQGIAAEKEKQRRAKREEIESDRTDTRQGPSRGREYR